MYPYADLRKLAFLAFPQKRKKMEPRKVTNTPPQKSLPSPNISPQIYMERVQKKLLTAITTPFQMFF
jgi:hypothetical protein